MAARRKETRSIVARIAANSRWAREFDTRAAMAPARRGFDQRFEREVDPEGVLPPDERARRVDNAKRAHFQRLALKSAETRRQRARRTDNPPKRRSGEPTPQPQSRPEPHPVDPRRAFPHRNPAAT
jgi:hypothetical protein